MQGKIGIQISDVWHYNEIVVNIVVGNVRSLHSKTDPERQNIIAYSL